MHVTLPHWFVRKKGGPHPRRHSGDADHFSEPTLLFGPVPTGTPTLGLNPLRPPPLPPTVEVRATEFCCTALAPVFWLACRMPWPPIEYVIWTLPS